MVRVLLRNSLARVGWRESEVLYRLSFLSGRHLLFRHCLMCAGFVLRPGVSLESCVSDDGTWSSRILWDCVKCVRRVGGIWKVVVWKQLMSEQPT